MASLVPSFSGGKDSTYMVLRLHELGIKMADIVCFDTGWEFPHLQGHIAQVEDIIKQKVTVLKPRESFDSIFAHRIRTKGKNKGLAGYGWPSDNRRWCTAEKTRATAAYANALSWQGLPLPVVQCIGYAADELDRVEEHSKKKAPRFLGYDYPLVSWGVTEAEALEYCKERGLHWNGLYDIFDRVSCWCCPLGGVSRAEKIYQYFPDYWQRMLEMESWIPEGNEGRKYAGKYTVSDLDKRFYAEAVKALAASRLPQQGSLPGMGALHA